MSARLDPAEATPTATAPATRRSPPEPGARRVRPVFASYSQTLVEATLERILGSNAFRRSQRHRQFLAHVVRAALANEHEQLKEVIIGLEVFGRALSSYDPRRDPIVRVEAGRLREKLGRYYADEGAAEAFEITIPVGSYMPQFTRRRSARPDTRHSIAILPFNNLTGHEHDAAFAIGLADQLIDTLGQVPAMKVVARVSAQKASEKELSPKALGSLLGVDHVVDGSIQRHGDRLRGIARLSRAAGGLQIWSQRFDLDDASSGDLFAFQDRIADAVLDAVTASLIDGSAAPGRPLGSVVPHRALFTHSNQARDLFERARYLALQGSIDGYRRAISLLEKAIAIDPAFAQAHSQLGAARANLGPYVFAPTIPTFAKVKEAVLRALELNPLDGDARALLAVIAHRIEAGWQVAEPLFIEALRIAPSSTLTHSSYAWGLVFNGRYDEAIAHARTAMELDPLNIAQRAYNARLYSYAGEYDTALSELRIVLELDPDHLYARVVLGIIHLSMNHPDEAMPHFEHVARAVPDHTSAHLHKICVYGMRGEIDRGRHELDALLAQWAAMPARAAPYFSPFYVALACACLGDRDGMLHHLERTATDRDYLFVTTPAHVLFDRYRGDPAFVDLLQRHGMALFPR